MTKAEMIEILMEDYCTRSEAEKHINRGTCIYEDPAEYIESLKVCGCYDGETLDDFRNRKLDCSMVMYKDHEYLIVYCL